MDILYTILRWERSKNTLEKTGCVWIKYLKCQNPNFQCQINVKITISNGDLGI